MQDGRQARGYTVGELVQAARRRARPALLVGGVVLLIGTAVVMALPAEYHAEATIILEPYRPHPELVTPAVTTLLEDRLRVAREALLSEPRLEQVVQEFHLYPQIVAKKGLEGGAAQLKQHLEIKPDGDSAIVLGYRTRDRADAAKVVAAVAHGFVQANADERIGQARRVHDILSTELTRVEAELDQQEAKVHAFQLKHDGELPEQTEANLREAERATHELETASTWLHDVDQKRALLPSEATSPELERLSAIEDDLQKQLIHAKALYSPDYPDTVRLTRELQSIRAEKAQAASHLGGMKAERQALAAESSKARRQVARLDQEIARARRRAEASAKWGAMLTSLERDRDLLRQKYQSLLGRKVESEVSLALEEKSAPLATDVIDPPSAPLEPAAPDRARLLVVVLALALGLAVGTGVFIESRDESLRTPAQTRERLDVPLLAVVPALKKRA